MKRLTLTSAQILAAGFLALAVTGALLLMLPLASAKGEVTPFIDALFTATSAVTTTGLAVVDTGTHYSIFGQVVILLLFQVGGLGYMIFIALIVLGLGRKLSLSNRILLHESIARPTSLDIRRFIKIVILFTLLFELAGAFLYTLFFMNYYPLSTAIYSGIFHSVSGFCTAGFSLYADSLSAWQDNIFLNIITIFIFTAGAVGFFVLHDIYVCIKKSINREKNRGLLAYSKFVIFLTVVLWVAGAVVIFVCESWPSALSFQQKILYSIFQSTTASTTTGFNTIDIGAMNPASLFFIIILMFIGASSGGTGGGIKIATFGLLVLFLITFFKGEEDVQIFNRRVSYKIINRAFAIIFVALLWLIAVSLILLTTEKASFLQVLFETASALGTTGLSTGITSSLSPVGKILISLTMLIGRIGPIAIGYSLAGRAKPAVYKYAKADILVG